MRIFGGTKKTIDKAENREEVPTLEVVEVVLIQSIYQTININKVLK